MFTFFYEKALSFVFFIVKFNKIFTVLYDYFFVREFLKMPKKRPEQLADEAIKKEIFKKHEENRIKHFKFWIEIMGKKLEYESKYGKINLDASLISNMTKNN